MTGIQKVISKLSLLDLYLIVLLDDANVDGEDRDKAVMSLVKLDDWITMGN